MRAKNLLFIIIILIFVYYFVTVENLLNKTDLEVMVFTGQLDLIVNTPGIKNEIFD